MTQEKIYFKNSKGDRLCGILSNPTGDKGKLIIIFCHGFNSSKESNTYITLEERLNNEKISTFRFDFFGHGESDGKFENITVSEAVDDALNAIDFLKRQGYLKMGLFGSSFGGITSIVTASKTNNLSMLALKSPVSDFEEVLVNELGDDIKNWEKRGYRYYIDRSGGKKRLNYSFFEDTKNNNGYQVAEKIEIPTLIVHGGDDEIVPVNQSRKTAQLIRDCKLEVIKGADHGYTKPEDFKKMIKIVSEFIAHSLTSEEN